MIISMRLHATKEEIDNVRARIEEFGYKVHSIEGEERVVIGAVGVGDVTACLESLEAMPGVERAMRISAPYKFVSKEFQPEKTSIKVRDVMIGGDEFVVMAGPCSVESEKQIIETARSGGASTAPKFCAAARSSRELRLTISRGWNWKGLKLLDKARRETGLGIITEVMSDRDVDMVAEYADILQIGARNMQNFSLLKTLGKCGRPILLKRGMSSTIKELLMSAEYIVAHGNPNVMLCERGIRTFETVTRNTCDIVGCGGAERDDASAGDSGSEPCHRQAQPGSTAGAGGGGDWRRRHDRRSASAAGESDQRWRAVSESDAVGEDDGGSAAVHRSVETGAGAGSRGCLGSA